MATNPYFSQNVRSEQGLFEDIVIESLKLYGQDIYYLPRDIVNEDRILGDDVPSRFNSSYKIEMWIENVDGFDGEGDLFTKFGVEIRDQATFVVSRRRWNQTILRHDNEITVKRPAEGDLLYIPFSQKLFQITHVEHEQPFYQLQNLPTFKLRCELFEYNDEDLDTNVATIDDIEKDYAYRYNLTLSTSQTQAIATSIIDSEGKVAGINISEAGAGYALPPLVTLSETGAAAATAEAIISTSGIISGVNITDSSVGYATPPTVTIAAPQSISFTVGNTAKQTLSTGVAIKGEIAAWSDSDNVLSLIHVGADDGKFHLPTTTIGIIDSDSQTGGIVQAVVEANNISANEQNNYFDTLTDFLDFSESNPFGDPS